jgi:hypothetical protein
MIRLASWARALSKSRPALTPTTQEQSDGRGYANLSPTSPRVMSTEEYLEALKTLYMPPFSRTTARELGMKV